MTNNELLEEEKGKLNSELEKWVKRLFLSIISTFIWTIGLDKGLVIIIIWSASLVYSIYSYFMCKKLGKQLSKLEDV